MQEAGRGRSRSGSTVGSGSGGVALKVKSVAEPRLLINIRQIQKTLQSEDEDRARRLQTEQTELLAQKAELTTSIKTNFVLERELKVIDGRIAQMIQNRVSADDVAAQMQRLTAAKEASDAALAPDKRELYSSLFYVLQREPSYLGLLPKALSLARTPAFIQAVAFTLFGDQYSAREELLLLSVFRKALQEEFNESTSMGSLLRGNSAVTKMIREYTRRDPGQAYLEKTLTGVLEDFVASDPETFEINPSKVVRALIRDEEIATGVRSTLSDVPDDQVADDPRVRAVIEPRIEKIAAQCEVFMQSVLNSLNDLPFGIRWLAKQIALMTQERFPDASRKARATMIGGFVYLRYINPAIVTPDADSYKLVRNKLTATVRRNLVLVAKVLQNLSNFVLFGDKEKYMLPLNAVIERYTEPLTVFFEELTDVPELEEYLKLDHQFVDVVSASTPTITISLNEIYLIHALLAENLAEVAGDFDDPVRDLISALGPAPAQVKVAENESVVLSLVPPAGSTFEGLDDENTAAETLYEEAKQLVQELLAVLHPSALPFSIHHTLETLLEATHESIGRTPSAQIELLLSSIEDKLSALEAEGVLSRNDSHSRLLVDISKETQNRALFEASLAKDRAKIERTLERVRSHHQFLLSQLESYNTYLLNVRQQGEGPSGGGKAKAKKKDKAKSKSKSKSQAFKISHDKLLKDGVIAESRVPEARRKKTVIVFSSDEPGLIQVSALFHGFPVDRMVLELDNLVDRSANGESHMHTEFVDLNLNLLLHLLNKLGLS